MMIDLLVLREEVVNVPAGKFINKTRPRDRFHKSSLRSKEPEAITSKSINQE